MEKLNWLANEVNCDVPAHHVLVALGYKEICPDIYTRGNDAVIINSRNNMIDGQWPGNFLLSQLQERASHSILPWNRGVSAVTRKMEAIMAKLPHSEAIKNNPIGFYETVVARKSANEPKLPQPEKHPVYHMLWLTTAEELEEKIELELEDCFIPARGEDDDTLYEDIEDIEEPIAFSRR